jgi:hypothetical protein
MLTLSFKMPSSITQPKVKFHWKVQRQQKVSPWRYTWHLSINQHKQIVFLCCWHLSETISTLWAGAGSSGAWAKPNFASVWWASSRRLSHSEGSERQQDAGLQTRGREWRQTHSRAVPPVHSHHVPLPKMPWLCCSHPWEPLQAYHPPG